ncbi:hypothetical protein, partial [Vibrio parahaemolyticus]|uniref:hypothetical protein n=1 Tax=Vibrio parahaemolyticus TaxID=670 RepID=UPI002150FF00
CSEGHNIHNKTNTTKEFVIIHKNSSDTRWFNKDTPWLCVFWPIYLGVLCRILVLNQWYQ